MESLLRAAELFENTARSVDGAPKEISIRHIRNCLLAEKHMAGGAMHWGIAMSEVHNQLE
jgi:hypothetical protein